MGFIGTVEFVFIFRTACEMNSDPKMFEGLHEPLNMCLIFKMFLLLLLLTL
jgi:hypothetical protein